MKFLCSCVMWIVPQFCVAFSDKLEGATPRYMRLALRFLEKMLACLCAYTRTCSHVLPQMPRTFSFFYLPLVMLFFSCEISYFLLVCAAQTYLRSSLMGFPFFSFFLSYRTICLLYRSRPPWLFYWKCFAAIAVCCALRLWHGCSTTALYCLLPFPSHCVQIKH